MRQRIVVLAEDVIEGRKQESHYLRECPVARAIRRTLPGIEVEVAAQSGSIGGDFYDPDAQVVFPKRVEDYIYTKALVSTIAVEDITPFEFEIDVPLKAQQQLEARKNNVHPH